MFRLCRKSDAETIGLKHIKIGFVREIETWLVRCRGRRPVKWDMVYNLSEDMVYIFEP